MMQIHAIHTEDQVRLHVAFFPPADKNRPVVLCTHGVANAFYNTPLWEVAQAIHRLGWGVALFNNRGHDWVSANPIDARWIGAAHERIEDCALDFKAGLDWLNAQGYRNLVIGGHSLGGLKANYALRTLPSGSFKGLAMFSSPRLPDEQVWDWKRHEDILDRCRALSQAGDGRTLMEVEMPTNTPAMRGLMCADTYINKYGPTAVTTVLRDAAGIAVPVFLLAGTKEHPQLAFSADMEKALVNAVSVTRAVIDGADHLYTDKSDQVASAFSDWLEKLFAGDPG
ncbi:Alpha/beta hydrolase family protein [Pigmentiphaga humi]|uniref:Alpha/beta hydrolase family protein n=1 Tax=Pigmentiphaga humi TaxID=2478468 RepID=A0A3P4AVC1_9BURK|nr:alpha/beta fold hydrolase [Pigmentiphaga humi]VCU67963.1 Alpha/beta hydrolase family protein [Pigmentiphaga humi]